MRDQEA